MKTGQELRSEKLSPPQTISEILHGSWAIRILKTACEISLFEKLQDGPKAASVVAASLTMAEEGIRLLLDSLVGLKLLKRADLAAEVAEENALPTYMLTGEASTYLLQESPLYIGMFLAQHDELDKMWRSLKQTLTTGQPVMMVNLDEQAEQIFPRLAESIFPLNYAIAGDVVRFLKGHKDYFNEPLTVLDLACGASAWSIPFAQENEHSKIDALDFPAVLSVTEKVSQKFGVAKQFDFISGNWRDLKLEPNRYDAVLLGHILHSEGLEVSQQLLSYCYKALRPGAVLVIAEYMTNEERTAPLYSLMFGLNMYLCTSEGCVFSFEQLRQMCFDAGFSDVIKHSAIQYQSPVVLAFK